MKFTRRRLLSTAAIGTSVSVSGIKVFSSDAVAYQSSKTVGSDPMARVEWRETYNGSILETGDETADGPVLNIGNAQPADSGTLAFQVTPTSTDSGANVRFSLSLDENNENGRNEPERKAGDTTADRGELADALEVKAWYDTGSFGVSGLGGCDGNLDAAETVLVDGSLVDADAALADGVLLGGDCLEPENGACVGISWSLPASVGNKIQGDSVDVSLDFTVESCGET